MGELDQGAEIENNKKTGIWQCLHSCQSSLWILHLLKEQIDLLASLLAGVAKNTDNIMAKQVATSSFGAQAKGGDRLRPSTAVTEAPLAKSVSVTSIIPKGAAKCRGLQNKII